MSEALTREEKKRRAIEKGKLLWKLVTTTAGVGDLAEPLRRVERNFVHLSKGQQITVVMIAHLFEEGIDAINEGPKVTTSEPVKPEVIDAELIPPSSETGKE
jgi:hypothetical protein